MKLNKKLEVAMNVLNALKTKNGITRTADLAVEIGTTTNLLVQVMRELKNANLVTVKRGPSGGFALNTNNVNTTAYDVAKALGRLTDSVEVDSNSATSRLRKSIVDAFLNTTI